jgi:hypothetical protein
MRSDPRHRKEAYGHGGKDSLFVDCRSSATQYAVAVHRRQASDRFRVTGNAS